MPDILDMVIQPITVTVVALGVMAILGLRGLLALGSTWQFHRRQKRFQKHQFDLWRVTLEAARARANRQPQTLSAWNGYRKFRIDDKTVLCDEVTHLTLVPHDGKPLPTFLPGQFLTFQLSLPDASRPVRRCYSLVSHPGDAGHYQVAIKRLNTPKPGKVSGLIFHHLNRGDLLDVAAPNGSFTLDLDEPRSAVLIAGGIGVTPFISMIRAFCQAPQKETNELWLFNGVRGPSQDVLPHLLDESIADRDDLHIFTCYSGDEEADGTGLGSMVRGHITVERLKESLPSSNFVFYLCGPSEMIGDMSRDLKAWGVPDDDIRFEAFSAESVRSVDEPVSDGVDRPVHFARSDVNCTWTAAAGTLLDLAEAQGVPLDSGCRVGNCGTCLTAIHSGSVTHLRPPALELRESTCLACISVPGTDLVLDA